MRRSLRWAIVGGVLVLGGSFGCRAAKTSFQMDSDNRMPQLGLQLTPSRETKVPARPSQVVPATGNLVAIDRSEAESPRTGWPAWWNRWTRPQRIPLPVTEVHAAEQNAAETGMAQHGGVDDF